ncbi:MAG: nitrogen fixation protein NifM [Chromatiaceae bacterium]|nr:MAG: nitrogen fixation protein NifM [Chromatiaceae bacterium]
MSVHAPAARAERTRGDYHYHLLRAASERFQCGVAALTQTQRQEAAGLAARTLALEDLVLGTVEAAAVVIPETDRHRAFLAIKERYASEAEFQADLARNRLDSAALRHALHRELTFDAVMQRIGSRHAPLSETDERLFYELHHDRFQAPERRTARHILITINDDYPENRRAAALTRLQAIAGQLAPGAGADGMAAEPLAETAAGDPDETSAEIPTVIPIRAPAPTLTARFARLARRHSECPTALDGGNLGAVPRGQLFPAVEAALFALDAGALSAIVESPLGLHLLLCERIQPGRALPFEQARPRIRAALLQRRRREAQRAWLAQVQSQAPNPATAN